MSSDPLITQALLGAARMGALPEAPTPELADLWPAFDPSNPADSLLRALAISRALRLAGTKAAPLSESGGDGGKPPPLPCPEETRPYLGAAMVEVGVRLLGGEHRELLAEWFEAALALDSILPPHLLPRLLSPAARETRHRPALRRLCGERGLWLARRRSEFAWLLEEAPTDADAWDEGSPEERLAWLRHRRASDPAGARAAVESQWAGETPELRARIVALFGESPAPDDQPFLESQALTDRRKEVREAAIAALLRIGGSPLRERAVERLRPLVRVERKRLRQHLVVEPPAAFDPAWAADGVREKAPRGSGERAWWLRQLAAMVPLGDWAELLERPLAQLLELPVEGDWAEPLRLGWIEAARRLPEEAGLESFVPWLASLGEWPRGAPPTGTLVGELLEALPAAERYAILERLHGRREPFVLLDWMARCGTAPEGAAPKCFAALRAAVLRSPAVLTRPQARELARCVPRDRIEAELRALAVAPGLTGVGEEFAAALDLRQSIHRAAGGG